MAFWSFLSSFYLSTPTRLSIFTLTFVAYFLLLCTSATVHREICSNFDETSIVLNWTGGISLCKHCMDDASSVDFACSPNASSGSLQARGNWSSGKMLFIDPLPKSSVLVQVVAIIYGGCLYSDRSQFQPSPTPYVFLSLQGIPIGTLNVPTVNCPNCPSVTRMMSPCFPEGWKGYHARKENCIHVRENLSLCLNRIILNLRYRKAIATTTTTSTSNRDLSLHTTSTHSGDSKLHPETSMVHYDPGQRDSTSMDLTSNGSPIEVFSKTPNLLNKIVLRSENSTNLSSISSNTTTTTTTGNEPPSSSKETLKIVLIACGAGLAFLLILFAMLLFCKRRHSNSIEYQSLLSSTGFHSKHSSSDRNSNLSSMRSKGILSSEATDRIEKAPEFFENLRYIDRLGRDLFGELLLCKDEISGQFVITKQISLLEPFNKDTATVLQAALKDLQLLRHKNINRLLDSWLNGDRTVLIAMEYVVSPFSLENLIAHNKQSSDPVSTFKISRYFRICLEISTGLEYLHSSRVVHGDLKAENILIHMKGSSVESVKLAECGISWKLKLFDRKQFAKLDSTKQESFYHLPPESILKKVSAERDESKVDIWSVGMILYYLLTMQRPDIKYTKQQMRNPLPKEILLDRSLYNLIKIYNQCTTPVPDQRPSSTLLKSAFHQQLIEEDP